MGLGDIGENMLTSQYKDKFIVVFGTASLQQYVFQSNKLNENIGASDLVRHWLSDGLIKATHADTTKWNEYKDDPIKNKPKHPFESEKTVNVIYIGGGNAALLCEEKSVAKKIVKRWSRQVLKKAPGLRVVVGYSKVKDRLAEAYKNALESLGSCEESLPYGSSLLSLPVVQSGLSTGQPASKRSIVAGGQEEWVSHSTWCKQSQIRDAQNNIEKAFPEVLKKTEKLPDLRFAIKLDEELGGRKGESHIAVVHADGNGIGDLLNQVIDKDHESDDDFLHDLRAFSASTSVLAHRALNNTLLHFKDHYLPLDSLKNADDVFPIRPIVYGGDDLTFVCDGRVGLHLASFYLQEFSNGKIRFCGEERPVDACAGVSIVRTKFPFFRAYSFADELCSMAKAHRRDVGRSEGSWLDFQIIQEGASKSISALRQEQYVSLYGQSLHKRPYQVPEDWNNCVEFLCQFKSQWPRSRAKGLLQALAQGPGATELFVLSVKWRNKNLPYVKGMDAKAKTEGWTGGKGVNRSTPYFDPLEMMDYYLEDLLSKKSVSTPKED